MRRNEWKVEDIVERGGTFIRKDKIKSTRLGNIYVGTLHFDDTYTDIMVRYYPRGGAVVHGPANLSAECLDGYSTMLKYLNRLNENDMSFRKTIAKRRLIETLLRLLIAVNLIGAIIDALTISWSNFGGAALFMAPRLLLLAVIVNVWVISKRY